MGKFETYEALQALGGKGTITQVREQLAKMYPQYSYSEFASNALNRLQGTGQVKHNLKTDVWTITGKFGPRNVVILYASGRTRRIH